MPARNYTNTHTQTTLAAPINASATSIQPTTLSGLPVSYPYYLIIDYGTAQIEVVQVDGVAGANLTVVRGQDNTTGQSHNAGAVIVHGVAAADVREPQTHIYASSDVHGLAGGASVVGTTTTQTLTGKTISGAANTLSAVPNSALVAIDAAKVTQPFTGVSTGTLTATGNATVGGTLGVTGATTAAALTATTVNATTVATTGNATVGGTLGVSGSFTAGTVTTAGATVTNNAVVGGTLGVTGTTTTGVLNSGNHAVTGTLSSTGNATVGGNATITGGTLNLGADGNLYRASANLIKTDDSLEVAGNLTVTGNLTGGNVYAQQIARQTLASPAAIVTFSGISGTAWRRLELRWTGRTDVAGTGASVIYMQPNADATAAYHGFYQAQVNAGSLVSNNTVNQVQARVGVLPNTTAGNLMASGEIEIYNWNYHATAKLIVHDRSFHFEGIGTNAWFEQGQWLCNITGPFTSLKLFPSAGNFATGTEFTLYGYQ